MSVSGDAKPVAGLTGERWLTFLDSRWEQNTFSGGAGRALIEAPYVPSDRVMTADVHELGALCVEWISTQRPED